MISLDNNLDLDMYECVSSGYRDVYQVNQVIMDCVQVYHGAYFDRSMCFDSVLMWIEGVGSTGRHR